eukprot:scaffold236406_cov35-Prasinocladus_malaysianus.AAC.2
MSSHFVPFHSVLFRSVVISCHLISLHVEAVSEDEVTAYPAEQKKKGPSPPPARLRAAEANCLGSSDASSVKHSQSRALSTSSWPAGRASRARWT